MDILTRAAPKKMAQNHEDAERKQNPEKEHNPT